MATRPDSPEALSFLAVAEKVAAALQGETHAMPNIIFE
jgi:hypothetical protein